MDGTNFGRLPAGYLPVWSRAWLLVAWLALTGVASAATPQIIYATGFEKTEGYSTQFTLAGQQHWIASGSGGNGILTNFFDDLGQAAYVGFFPPTVADDVLSLLRPLNYTPDLGRQAVVQFSVLMEIVDSQTKPNRDDFRWSFYNIQGSRLFSLNFDNETLLTSYALDDELGFTSTGTTFTNTSAYELVVTMNFNRNLWSAAVNGLTIVNAKPISTKFNIPLSLGDVDAVWLPQKPGSPGDNYMVFDEYKVTVQSLESMPPRLEAVSKLPDGRFLLRLHGEPGLTYSVEASGNLTNWTAMHTLTASSTGTVDLLDETAKASNRRFYRAHQVAQ